MNLKRYVQWTITILLAGSATLSAQLKVDWDKSISFTNFKTYTWGKGTPLQNSLWDQRIIDGVDQQLAGKGMQKVGESSNPDTTPRSEALSN